MNEGTPPNTTVMGQTATGTEDHEHWDSATGGSSSPSWGSGFFNQSRNFAGTIGFGGGTGASLEFGRNTIGDVSTKRNDKYLKEYPVMPLVPSEPTQLVTATVTLLIPAESCHVSRDTERLRAYKNRTAITDAIRDSNKVTLITGGTGCGKTSQIVAGIAAVISTATSWTMARAPWVDAPSIP